MLHVFISGPIRPSLNDVLLCIRTLKSQLPPCKIWFSTWETSEPLDLLRAEVDTLIVNREPIFLSKAKTWEARAYPNTTDGVTARTFKMFVGIENIFKVAQCAPDDIVIRFRSDLLANFAPGYLQQLIEAGSNGYVTRKRKTSVVEFDDWFAVTTYTNMRNVWCHYGGIQDFEDNMNRSHNAEDMVKRRAEKHGLHILQIDEKQIDFALCRANNERYRLD
jgi:hypothetical protein